MNNTEWYRLLYKAGLCVDCTQEDAYTMSGRYRCAECTERHKARQRMYRAKPGNSENARDKTNALRQERKDNGLCPKCGRKVTGRFVNCDKCRAKARNRQQKYRNSITPEWLRGRDGRCYRCNVAKAESGFKTCPACHAELTEHIARVRKAPGGDHPWIFERRKT